MQLKKRAAKFIWKYCHPVIYAHETKNGIRPVNYNKQFERAIKGQGFVKNLTLKAILQHLENKLTLFYASNYQGEILVCLDLDNHFKGRKSEGVRFFRYLRENYAIFKNLYWEDSTHGKGLHGYVRICLDGADFGSKMKNEQLRDLEDCLRTLKIEGQFDFGDIEIKATIPEVSWKTGEPKVKSAQLCKMPRNWRRIEDLENTSKFTWGDLMEWKFEIIKRTEERLKRIKEMNVSAVAESPSSRTSDKSLFAIARKKMNPSVSPISRKWIQRIPSYKKYTQFLIEDIKRKSPEFLRARGRRRISQLDLMFALALVAHLSEVKRKSNEAHMPHNLIQKTWESCFESGIVSRVWDNSRWAKIRQIFSHYGLIEWKSSKYHFFAGSDKKGKACEWRFSDAAIQGLIELGDQTERDSFVNTIPQIHSETHSKSIYDAVRPVLIYPMDEIPVWKPDKQHPESIQRVISRLVCV